jgi:hypothetical protein
MKRTGKPLDVKTPEQLTRFITVLEAAVAAAREGVALPPLLESEVEA